MSYDRSMERILTIADEEECEIYWELMQQRQISQSEDEDPVALEMAKEKRAMWHSAQASITKEQQNEITKQL